MGREDGGRRGLLQDAGQGRGPRQRPSGQLHDEACAGPLRQRQPPLPLGVASEGGPGGHGERDAGQHRPRQGPHCFR